MTTSQTAILSEIDGDVQISAQTLAYFRGRLRHRLHDLVVSEFIRLEVSGAMNRAKLAKRIGKDPSQITKWLGVPSNWTLDTVSDLLVGMKMEPRIAVSLLGETRTEVVGSANIPSHPSVINAAAAAAMTHAISATSGAFAVINPSSLHGCFAAAYAIHGRSGQWISLGPQQPSLILGRAQGSQRLGLSGLHVAGLGRETPDANQLNSVLNTGIGTTVPAEEAHAA